MSTLKKNITSQRIATLATKKEILFHIDDLANLWKINNPNSLRTTLKRYVQSGLLHRIYRGFYSLVPLDEIDPILLGARALHRFCYLTTHSILFRHGYISQKIYAETFVSEKSAQFHILDHQFISHQLHPKYLYNPAGIFLEGGVNRASPERAIADFLYFNSKAYLDRPVDWKTVRNIQKIVGYPLTPHRYDSA